MGIIYGESILYDIIAFTATCLLIVYTLLQYQLNKWTRRGIPSSNVHPVFGNIKDVVLARKTFRNYLREFYLEHKQKPYVAFFTFSEPAVMINDLELVKNVLIKDFNTFPDRNFNGTEADPLQYHGIFTMKGQPWRDLRIKLSPTFTSGKLKKMFELIDACGQDLIKCMEQETGKDNGSVAMKDVCARYTTDVIATCICGINGGALKDPNSYFRQMLRRSTAFDLKQNIIIFLMFMYPKVVEKLSLSITAKDVANYFRKTVWDTVEYREKNNVVRNDFLSLLMQLKKEGRIKDENESTENGTTETNDKIDLEGDKFVSQCFVFLAAGFDTSSSTMTNALYEMAFNKEVQNKLYEEITTVLANHDGKVTYDAVQEMTYLHMVLQETLRKYPLLLLLDRKVNQPYRLPGSSIELIPGDSVVIPVLGIHYDPDIYPDPDKFDPERFSEEQKRERPSCSFLGFGDGPRICIGMRLGYLQSKVGLIYTLLNYEVSPTPKTPAKLEFGGSVFVLHKTEVPLHFTKRTSSS